MDINEAWNKINKEKFSSSIKKEEIMKAISQESSLTISELKKRLKYKLYWVVLFTTCFVGAMLWNFNNPEILGFFTLALILYLYGGVGLYSEYKEMDDHIDSSKDTLSEMKKHRDSMKRALANENRWGLLTFPIIIIASLILPKLLKGFSISDLLVDPKFIGMTIVCLLVLTPLANWASNKMNNIGYGKYLKKLEDNIKKMEEL